MRENISNCRTPRLKKKEIRELRRVLFVLIRYCWAPNSVPSSGRAMVSGAILNARLAGVLTPQQYERLKRLNFAWYDQRIIQIRTEEEVNFKKLLEQPPKKR